MERDDFAVDLEELFNDIDNAEVVSISFPTFDKSAVFDMRSNESDGPMLRLMPMVSSPVSASEASPPPTRLPASPA